MKKSIKKFIKYLSVSIFTAAAIAIIPTAIILSTTIEQETNIYKNDILKNGDIIAPNNIEALNFIDKAKNNQNIINVILLTAPVQNVQNPDQITYQWYWSPIKSYKDAKEITDSVSNKSTLYAVITQNIKWFFCVIKYKNQTITTPLKETLLTVLNSDE